MALTASSILHYWSARHGVSPIYGGKPVATRSSAARIADQRGIVHAPIINTPRIGWETIATERRPVLHLEMARTNGFTYSQEFDNAAWTKTRVTVSANAAIAPDGTLTADKLVEDTGVATTHLMTRVTPTLTDSTDSGVSIFAKAGERSWIFLRMDDKGVGSEGSYFNLSTGALGTAEGSCIPRIESLGNGWYRCSVSPGSSTGANPPTWKLYIAEADNDVTYTGDGASGVYIWGAQFETDKPHTSSYVPTTSATATRSVDSFYWDYPPAPQQMAVYVRFVENGTIYETGSARILQIGASGNTDPRLIIYSATGVYHALWSNNSTSRQWDLVAAPSIGNTVELVFRIDSDGTGVFIQSVNGAAVSSVTNASTQSFASTWSDTRLWLNSVGSTSPGCCAFAEVKIVKRADLAGTTVQAVMNEMRDFQVSAAGVVLA